MEPPPLIVDFLPPAVLRLPGRLGLTMAPGRRDGSGERHDRGAGPPRDLARDLRRLRHELRTDLLVTLLSVEELSHLGVPDLFVRAAEHGLITHWFPMRDLAVPPSRARVAGLVEQLLSALIGGSTVVLHCREGRGRSGLIAAACLMERGLSCDEALAAVRRARPGAVETREQEAFLRGF